MTWHARHISQSIQRKPAEVAAFARDHMADWAGGLSADMKVKFAPPNEFGVLDHDVEFQGKEFHNPLRVLANDAGSEVVFTLYRHEGVSDADFEKDAAKITSDLEKLRSLLEK